MRVLIDGAYRMRRIAMRVLRWRTSGVRVMVFDAAGRLLLIRHRYGNTALWMTPGGGIDRGETPERAAEREVLEETGCRVSSLAPIGVFHNRAEGRRDTVHLFRGLTTDAAQADGIEVADACFHALDALPPETSPATLRRIAEMIGQRAVTGQW